MKNGSNVIIWHQTIITHSLTQPKHTFPEKILEDIHKKKFKYIFLLSYNNKEKKTTVCHVYNSYIN